MAIFAAVKLGVIRELRTLCPAVVKDVTDGLRYYWAAFHQPDLFVQRTTESRMLRLGTDEELTTAFYYVEQHD